jgi:hypothetical protein
MDLEIKVYIFLKNFLSKTIIGVLVFSFFVMKIQTECVPCLIKRIIFESEQSTKNPKIKKKAIKNACKALGDFYDPNECSASIATKVHRIVYDTLKDDDPYKNLKKQSNSIAKKLLPKIEEYVKNSDNKLKTSMLCSIIGNMMDFGIEGGSKSPETLEDKFDRYFSQGLSYDDYNKLDEILSKSKKVLLFTDNCGEIVFDKILCKELKKKYPYIYLTLVVKGRSVLSDATLSDAIELGFEEIVDEIITTGCFAVGVDFEKMPNDLKKALNDCDLIICKGMANYESFSETNFKPIAYLLRTKCNAIANSMDLSLNISAIKLYK